MSCSGKILDAPGELVDFINTGSRFIIAGHIEPDGDCVGSQLALRSALSRLGKNSILCAEGPFKRAELKSYIDQFTEIEYHEYCQSHDTRVIIVDCSGMERIGSLRNTLEKFDCAIIDHHTAVTHPPSTATAPVYVDAASPSCTLLIYKLIKRLGLQLTEEEASMLLFGLCTDTGFFRHMTERNSDAFDAATEMIRSGASPKSIFGIMNGGKSLKSRILIGNLLARTEEYFDGRLLITSETLEESNTFGFESRDSESLNQLLLSIKNVEALAVIRQECEENCTVSLRSVDKINVAQIASSYNGGGHKNASGLTMKGDITLVKNKILESFTKCFNS